MPLTLLKLVNSRLKRRFSTKIANLFKSEPKRIDFICYSPVKLAAAIKNIVSNASLIGSVDVSNHVVRAFLTVGIDSTLEGDGGCYVEPK